MVLAAPDLDPQEILASYKAIVTDGVFSLVKAGEPPGRHYYWDIGSRVFKLDLALLKADQMASLRRSCEQSITSGFQYGDFFYPSDENDQSNLTATVNASKIAIEDEFPFLCRNGDGTWFYRMHTAEEIQLVGLAGYRCILAKRVHHNNLRAQIEESDDPEFIQSIVWTEPTIE